MTKSKAKKFIFLLIVPLTIGLVLPQNYINPVEGADKKSYNQESFWYYPWGKSGTHKGVDIFAKEGRTVKSATSGFVLYTGNIDVGGNVVLIIGPKWRLHYYAHLKENSVGSFIWTSIGDKIGEVGTTGNAKGKPPHLHYSIITLLPYIWNMDSGHDGWKKMFYINPVDMLNNL